MGEQRSRRQGGAAAAVPVAKAAVEVLGGAPKHSALMPAPAVMGEGAWAALVVRTAIEGEGGRRGLVEHVSGTFIAGINGRMPSPRR